MNPNRERRGILRIGTRGSRLARIQAEAVRAALMAAEPAWRAPGALEIVEIRTTGDREQGRRLADIGGKGLFTKEIEEALADGRIDMAVPEHTDRRAHRRPRDLEPRSGAGKCFDWARPSHGGTVQSH